MRKFAKLAAYKTGGLILRAPQGVKRELCGLRDLQGPFAHASKNPLLSDYDLRPTFATRPSAGEET